MDRQKGSYQYLDGQKIESYFEFDENGNTTISVDARDHATYFYYDALNRQKGSYQVVGGEKLETYFEFDANGNVTDVYDPRGGRVQSVYDELNRVTGVTDQENGSTYFVYDEVGNRTKVTDAADQTTYFGYDPDGNLEVIAEPGRAVTYFEHGSHGLVTKIKPLGGTEVEFGYDALLRRVRMTEGATTTYFRHDGGRMAGHSPSNNAGGVLQQSGVPLCNLLELVTSAGSVTKLTHGHTPIDGIGSVVEVDIDGTLYYFEQDHRGTLRTVTDAAGAVVWDAFCDAWGRVLSETGADPTVFFYQGQAWFLL